MATVASGFSSTSICVVILRLHRNPLVIIKVFHLVVVVAAVVVVAVEVVVVVDVDLVAVGLQQQQPTTVGFFPLFFSFGLRLLCPFFLKKEQKTTMTLLLQVLLLFSFYLSMSELKSSVAAACSCYYVQFNGD